MITVNDNDDDDDDDNDDDDDDSGGGCFRTAMGELSRRRVALVLLLVLLTDMATVKSSPPHRLALKAAAGQRSSGVGGDAKSTAMDGVSNNRPSSSGNLVLPDPSEKPAATSSVRAGDSNSVSDSDSVSDSPPPPSDASVRTVVEENADDEVSHDDSAEEEEGVTAAGQRQEEETVSEELRKTTDRIARDMEGYNKRVKHLGDIMQTIRGICGEAVTSVVSDVLVNEGDERDVVQVLTAIALLQLHDCPLAALRLAVNLATVADVTDADDDDADDDDVDDSAMTKDSTHDKASADNANLVDRVGDDGSSFKNDRAATGAAGRGQKRRNHCDAVAECRQKDVTTVRQILSRQPSLLTLYDVVASAVFASSRTDAVAEAMVDEVVDDLRLNKTQKMAAAALSATGKLRLSRRSACVDKTEDLASQVIGFVPFIGTVYSLVSAAVYLSKGCVDVAAERAASGVIDVATAGTGSVAKSLGKTVAKLFLKSIFSWG